MSAPRCILVIDDEDDVRELARVSLGDVGGYAVLDADNGEDGVRIAREAQPDAILLDARMPHLDGPATIRLLRADPDTAAIPVVFFTASVQANEREELRRLGAEGLLQKPFDPVALAGELAALLGW